MTIDLTDNAPRISYAVSTSTTSFAVPFEFFDDADLVVVVDGNTRTLTTHYTVSGGNGSTGTVTMTAGNAVTSGTVIIFRNIAFKRTTDFPTSGAFPIATLNTELDRNIALFDDQQDRIDRAVRLNDNDDAASMVLPLKASRKGTVLGFNATTGAAEAGPTIANVNSLADITTNINTVAGIASNVTTVAGIDANVSTVAGISSNVSTVANIQSNVSSVAGNATNINTVAGSIANVNTVATNIADVNAVAADLAETVSEIETVAADLQETQSEIDTVATNIANVNTVGNAITNVNTTATNISNINTLAGISSNVSTVAGINSDVTTVAGISSNVTAVAGDATDIGTVATNIANVNTVGGISGNVTTVAGISGNVSTVAGISSNVSTVAGIDTDVSTVAGISSNVTSVANDASDIGTVASAISNVNTVAGNTTNINTVAGNNSNISTVGGISSNVTTVAGIASNVTTVAGISSDVTTVANDATDIGTVSTNISNVNTLANALSGTNAYTVTVVNSGGNKFALNGATNPTLTLKRGITYTFDQSDNTNSGHPLAFKDGSGNSYTTGVTVTGTAGQAGAKVVFAVPSNAPSSLLYYCTVHGNAMGNTISVQDDNVAIVAGISSDITSVAGVASNVTTVAGIASNVTTVASNVSGINDFADRYRVASSAPSSNNDEGDLYYNTTSDQLFVYNGSAWISAALDASSALVPSNNLSDVASASTARTNLGLGDAATKTVGISNGNVATFTSGVADNDFLKIDGTTIEGRSAAEMRSDLNVADGATNYGDSNVDTHLNRSSAGNNQFLQWSGSDYQWADVDLSSYLTSSTAASTYLTQSSASSTYAPLNQPTFTNHITSPIFYTGVGSQALRPDGNDLKLVSQSGDIHAYFHNDGAAKLYFDNAMFLNAEVGGVVRILKHDDQNDMLLRFGDQTGAKIHSVHGSFTALYNSGSTGNDKVIDGHVDSYTYLFHNGNGVARTVNDGFQIYSANDNDDGTLYLGDDGYARLQSDRYSNIHIRNGVNEYVLWGEVNSRTYLYYDSTAAIYTDAGGAYVVTGSSATSGTLYLGNSGNSFISNQAGTTTYIRNYQGDNFIYGQDNSYTYIYYDGNWRLRTTSAGIEVNGPIVFNGTLGVSGNPSSYGSSGQVLTSNGNASPTWQDAAGGAWEEVSSTALTGTGTSSTIRNFSVSADILYRFTFTKFYWQNGADEIAIRLSQDSGSSWKNIYGIRWKRQSWVSMTYSNTGTQTNSQAPLQARSISTSAKYGHWIQVYVHTVTNGGAWVWSRAFGKTNSYENNETGFRGAVYGENGPVNYIRLQANNSTSDSSQGMRGHLRVEKWST